MPSTSEFRDWVLEQLRSAGPVTARSMFGGFGLYMDGIFFALIANDVLYFKVDDSNRPDFEAAGSGPFRPYEDERTMQYFEVPADVLEDGSALTTWSLRAVDVARRAKANR
jgi:DNA transformation protein